MGVQMDNQQQVEAAARGNYASQHVGAHEESCRMTKKKNIKALMVVPGGNSSSRCHARLKKHSLLEMTMAERVSVTLSRLECTSMSLQRCSKITSMCGFSMLRCSPLSTLLMRKNIPIFAATLPTLPTARLNKKLGFNI